MLYNVKEILVYAKRAGKSKYLSIPKSCWIDMAFPVSAAVMGFENLLHAHKLNDPKFSEPEKYQTYVLVQEENLSKQWIFSLKRKWKHNTYQTYAEQVFFFQSKM
jgi:hypothetical protein